VIMSADVRINGTTASLEVDTAVYSLPALKKTAYRMADRCSVVFGVLEGSRVTVALACPPSASNEQVRTCVFNFFEEALDQDLRERIAVETTPLRNLILAHAFSRTKLVPEADG
jgi:His-Xaa-Ser system protein HxsD